MDWSNPDGKWLNTFDVTSPCPFCGDCGRKCVRCCTLLPMRVTPTQILHWNVHSWGGKKVGGNHISDSFPIVRCEMSPKLAHKKWLWKKRRETCDMSSVLMARVTWRESCDMSSVLMTRVTCSGDCHRNDQLSWPWHYVSHFLEVLINILTVKQEVGDSKAINVSHFTPSKTVLHWNIVYTLSKTLP